MNVFKSQPEHGMTERISLQQARNKTLHQWTSGENEHAWTRGRYILLDDRSTTRDKNTKAAMLRWQLRNQSENDANKKWRHISYTAYTWCWLWATIRATMTSYWCLHSSMSSVCLLPFINALNTGGRNMPLFNYEFRESMRQNICCFSPASEVIVASAAQLMTTFPVSARN